MVALRSGVEGVGRCGDVETRGDGDALICGLVQFFGGLMWVALG